MPWQLYQPQTLLLQPLSAKYYVTSSKGECRCIGEANLSPGKKYNMLYCHTKHNFTLVSAHCGQTVLLPPFSADCTRVWGELFSSFLKGIHPTAQPQEAT